MPQMDGYQVLENLKLLKKDYKIIAQTAYALSSDIKLINEAGFTDYIAKPIKPAILYKLLDKYLS